MLICILISGYGVSAYMSHNVSSSLILHEPILPLMYLFATAINVSIRYCATFTHSLTALLTGGFFGSTDPSSEALAQKRSLLVSEGVLLDSKPSILAATGDEGRSARKRRRSEGRSPLDEESLIRVNSLCLHVF